MAKRQQDNLDSGTRGQTAPYRCARRPAKAKGPGPIPGWAKIMHEEQSREIVQVPDRLAVPSTPPTPPSVTDPSTATYVNNGGTMNITINYGPVTTAAPRSFSLSKMLSAAATAIKYFAACF